MFSIYLGNICIPKPTTHSMTILNGWKNNNNQLDEYIYELFNITESEKRYLNDYKIIT